MTFVYMYECIFFSCYKNYGSFFFQYRFVVLIMDEMKVQENLVYDRTGQRLHGFVNLGDVNSDLVALESELCSDKNPSDNIASHVLTLMIRGIFFNLEFPYANFPTQGSFRNSILCWFMYMVIWFDT